MAGLVNQGGEGGGDTASRYSGIMYASPRDAALNIQNEAAADVRSTNSSSALEKKSGSLAVRNKTPVPKFYNTGNEF